MNKKVFFKPIQVMLFWGIVGFLCYTKTGWTATNAIFTEAYNKLYETFNNARVVVYILSGFGLVGLATAAIFGKLSFRWLATIAIALFVLASAEQLVKTVVEGDKLNSTFTAVGSDTFILTPDASWTTMPVEFNTTTSGKTILDSAKIQ